MFGMISQHSSPRAIQNKSVTEKKEDAKPLLTVEQRLRAMHSSLELSLTCKEQRKHPAVNDKITACNKKRPFEMYVEDSLTKRANFSSVVDSFDEINLLIVCHHFLHRQAEV